MSRNICIQAALVVPPWQWQTAPHGWQKTIVLLSAGATNRSRLQKYNELNKDKQTAKYRKSSSSGFLVIKHNVRFFIGSKDWNSSRQIIPGSYSTHPVVIIPKSSARRWMIDSSSIVATSNTGAYVAYDASKYILLILNGEFVIRLDSVI